MKTTIWDFIFMALLTGTLILLSETGYIAVLNRYPFIALFATYLIGRFIGEFVAKRRAQAAGTV